MPDKLKVQGQVFYSDGPPAAGATVWIRDEDGLGGAEDDRILKKVTNAAGGFVGAGYWEDQEAPFVPDLLRLAFHVKADGKEHDGPFVRIDSRHSLPVILPWAAPRPVGKDQRELVQVIYVDKHYADGEKNLYSYIEQATEGLTRSILGGSYSRITFLKNADATLDGVVQALTAAAGRAGVKAVDLIFSTHGATKLVLLAGGETADTAVQAAIEAMPNSLQSKLRVCFSTACFGRSHLDNWQAAGFTDASGAKGIYADSEFSYAPMLMAWAAGQNFAESVEAANTAGQLGAGDSTAKAYYMAIDKPKNAALVDSTRVRVGAGASRIYSKP